MLIVEDLIVRYGAIQAVKHVNLSVQQGEMVCLLGSNGAGKTSVLRALAGLQPFTANKAVLGGQIDLRKQAAHERIASGMALVPEGRGIFAQLTVAENLALGAYCLRDTRDQAALAERWLDTFPVLKARYKQLAGTLSGGEQQMLAIARAMMANPKLLLLDEPGMGLAPQMVNKVFEVISMLHQDGLTILLVEQNASRALGMADRAYVLESGAVGLSGPAKALLDDPRVIRAYLGASQQA